MNIDPISLPEFPLSGLAMEPHMAAIQAWGMACAKVGMLQAFNEAIDHFYLHVGQVDGKAVILEAPIRRLRDQLTEGK